MTSGMALGGVNVLDLSESIGGAYCTKLLADLGADVVLVESTSMGHPLRHAGPYSADPGMDSSGMFLHYGANKRSIVCDVESDAGRGRVHGLASEADILVESFEPGYLDSIGLGYEAVSDSNQALVYTSVTHFGQTGPNRHWKSDEITDYAMGGYMYFGGHADREPLMMNNNQPMLHAGAQAAIASLSALRWARLTGEGQHIDVSSVEAMLSAHAWTSTSWTHEGVVLRRTGPDCIPCKDGWVWFFPFRWDPTFFILIDQPELMDDPDFSDRQSWSDNRDRLVRLLTEWCSDKTKDEIFRAGQELRVPVTPVNDAADLLGSSQLRHREWFQRVDHPKSGSAVLPGFPYVFSKTPARIRRSAPRLDEHARFDFVLSDRPFRAIEREEIVPLGIATSRAPLAGVRVLELTANWAGPLAARHLADLGAEVIKIEAPDRPATRGGRYPGGDPFRHHYNRAAYFNKLNRNKLGITLNLDDDEGREVFLRLVAESDVVLENNSPRVMRNFDLQYPVLREVNPEIIMVSISGFGQTGPDRDYVAYGANVEASCGLAAATGYADDDRPYRSTLFYADPVTGAHAAIAILAALHHRETSGEGQYVDMSLHENGITFFPEAVLEYTVTGKLAKRRGNRHPMHAPQGCYPSYGDDSWMSLCIRSAEEWKSLAETIGRADLAADPELATPAGRRSRHDEIDMAISEWTRQYDHNEAASMLQDAGVPAAPVLANWEMVSNRHFHARGFYQPMEHPEMGVFPYPGIPWKLSATPGVVRKASPLYGEHNSEVFRGLLGLSEEELAPLYARRAIADEPSVDLPTPVRPQRAT